VPAALVVHDRKTARFAMNVLVGAVEADPRTRELPVHVARSPAAVAEAARAAVAAGRRPLVAWSFYTASFPEVAAELRAVRAALPDGSAVHLAGGAHASAAPAATLAAGFDLVATGEGEETLPAVLDALAAGRDPRAVPGLAWRGPGGALATSGRAPDVDLDGSPPGAPRAGRAGPIEITRGCVWACRFCRTPFQSRARFRHRSLASVVEWVRVLGEVSPKDVRFVTPSALSWGSAGAGCDLAAVEALLSAVRGAAGSRRVIFGSFPSELRPEHVTPEALALLHRWCDNRQIILGGQSGSDRLLAAMGRGHDAATVTRAAALALEAGFRPSVDFVFGAPGETEDDRVATRAQVERLARLGARVHAHTFDPLPGTPWGAEAPGRLDEKTAALLERLAVGGRAYGDWTSPHAVRQR
jgi:B12-binding domain/radical SAM domain protein